MRGLAIQLLGPFHVTLDGQPVSSFGYDKVRALLAYLAVEQQRPHRREALAGLLWPDQAEIAAESSLRNALSRLRQAIGDQQANPSYLAVNREEIQFNPDSEHWVDAWRFSSLLEACRATITGASKPAPPAPTGCWKRPTCTGGNSCKALACLIATCSRIGYVSSVTRHTSIS
jgi:DNA-binding SARP family transcriptional activator